MKVLKQVPLVIVLALLPVFAVAAMDHPDKPGRPAPVIVSQAKYPITVQGGEYDLLTMIIDFPKGAGFPEHFHGGHVLATVVSGELTLKEKGAERVIKAGESWTESPGAKHSVINKGSTVRVSVSMLLPKGADAQTMVK